MYEIILTNRSDFSEKSAGCYKSRKEAEAIAGLLAMQHAQVVVRAWIRQVRQAKTGRGNSESKEKTDS